MLRTHLFIFKWKPLDYKKYFKCTDRFIYAGENFLSFIYCEQYCLFVVTSTFSCLANDAGMVVYLIVMYFCWENTIMYKPHARTCVEHQQRQWYDPNQVNNDDEIMWNALCFTIFYLYFYSLDRILFNCAVPFSSFGRFVGVVFSLSKKKILDSTLQELKNVNGSNQTTTNPAQCERK